MEIEVSGLAKAIATAQGRAERARDLRRPLRAFGEIVVRRTDDNYQGQHNWDGSPFAPLAPSTLERRMSKIGKAKRKGKNRRFTKGARKMREAIRAAGGAGYVTILVDTARMRNSNHCDPPEPTLIRWSSVGYLAHHMTGTGRMPERNPTPFIVEGQSVHVQPDVNETMNAMLTSYVMTGEPKVAT